MSKATDTLILCVGPEWAVWVLAQPLHQPFGIVTSNSSFQSYTISTHAARVWLRVLTAMRLATWRC